MNGVQPGGLLAWLGRLGWMWLAGVGCVGMLKMLECLVGLLVWLAGWLAIRSQRASNLPPRGARAIHLECGSFLGFPPKDRNMHGPYY